jgi:transposase
MRVNLNRSCSNTCKLHGIDPQTYLADVIERIISGAVKVNGLSELLPRNWKAARERAATA